MTDNEFKIKNISLNIEAHEKLITIFQMRMNNNLSRWERNCYNGDIDYHLRQIERLKTELKQLKETT